MSKGATWIEKTIVESPYCIGLCTSEEQFRQELKRLKVPDYQTYEWLSDNSEANVNELINDNTGERCYIVSIRKTKKSNKLEDHISLVHEAVHVWQHIKNGIGESAPSDEFEAYSISNIARNLIEAYDK